MGTVILPKVLTHRQRTSRILARLPSYPNLFYSGALRRAGRGCQTPLDRKSTRLNSSLSQISYAVFCLKKKKININHLEVRHYLTTVSAHISGDQRHASYVTDYSCALFYHIRAPPPPTLLISAAHRRA